MRSPGPSIDRGGPSSGAPNCPSDQSGPQVARQVVCGLATLLHESAAELPSPAEDWPLLFGLLEVCGAGAFPISEQEINSAGGAADPLRLDRQRKHEVMC